MSQGPFALDFDQRPSVPSHVLTRVIGDEMVLLSLDSESYFGLDAVGTSMWRKVATSGSLQQAYEELLDEYDVDPERLRDDLEGLVHDLVEKGLLLMPPPSDPSNP